MSFYLSGTSLIIRYTMARLIVFYFLSIFLFVIPAASVEIKPIKVSDLDAKSFLKAIKGKGTNWQAIPVPKPRTVGIQVVYSPTKDPVLNQIRKRYMQAQVWEKTFLYTNDTIKYRNKITFQMAECGAPGAFWSPREWRMIMCYEMILNAKFAFEVNNTPKKSIDKKVHGAIIGIAWHEYGHFLADEFDLPIVGNREDAADQVSTLVLLARGGDNIDAAIAHGELQAHVDGKAFEKAALALLGSKPERMKNLQRHMKAHSGGQKRRHNLLCLLYGSNPKHYSKLVGKDGLHPVRAASCEDEFGDYSRAWTTLLKSHTFSPQEIAVARCTRSMNRAIKLMKNAGAPPEAMKKAAQDKNKKIRGCTNAYMKDRRSAEEIVSCTQFAKNFNQVRACGN